MESGSQYRASVALCALAAVGSPEMLSELSSTILSLIKDKDSVYIRKKAMIVALKTTQVAPEVSEVFIDPCIAGILDKSHSVPLSAVQLGFELINNVDCAIEKFERNLTHFVKLLQDL